MFPNLTKQYQQYSVWLKIHTHTKENFRCSEAEISLGHLKKLIDGELVAGEINNMADQELFSIWDFCDKPILSDHANITDRWSLSTIVDISLAIGDGFHDKLLARTLSIPAHNTCKGIYKTYAYIKRSKWELYQDRGDEFTIPRPSRASTFDIKTALLW